MASDTAGPQGRGHFVFIQSKPGFTKIELTQKLSDALEVLGIRRYILLIDLCVEEYLGRRTSSIGLLGGKRVPKPRFPILDSPRQPCEAQSHMRKRSSQLDETQVQYKLLHAYAEKLHRQHPSEPWVLLIECSFHTRFDYARLQLLSRKFGFSIHWLPTGTKKEQNAKFQLIVVEILTSNDPTRKRKSSGDVPAFIHSSDVQMLHENLKAFEEADKGRASNCTFDTIDVVLDSPPFFTDARGSRRPQGTASSGSFTSCPESSESESDSFQSEIEFEEDEVFQVALELASKLPPPNAEHFVTIGKNNPENNIRHVKPVYVLLVRDIFPGPPSHISTLFKEALRRKGIKSNRLTVSKLFVDPNAFELMKSFALRNSSMDFETSVCRGCSAFVISILHWKLSQRYPEPLVFIIDVEDERYVRIFGLLDFCTKVGLKTLVLEKRPDGTFEQNFKRAYNEIKKGCAHYKSQKLKLPKFNLAFIKELLPAGLSETSFPEEPQKLTADIFRNLIFHMQSSPAASEIQSSTMVSTTLCNEQLVTPSTPFTQGEQLATPVESTEISSSTSSSLSSAASMGQQFFNFFFQRSAKTANSEVSKRSGSFGLLQRRLSGSVLNILKRPNTTNAETSQACPEVSMEGSVHTLYSSQLSATESAPSSEASLPIDLAEGEVAPLPNVENSGDDFSTSKLKLCEVLDENLNTEIVAETCTEQSTIVASVGVISDFSHPTAERSIGNDDLEQDLERRLSFPSPSAICRMDFIPPEVQNDAENNGNLTLIQICRLPPKKRRKIEEAHLRDSSSEESLFKGWVGRVVGDQADADEKKKVRNFMLRIISSIQTGIRNFVVGPFRNAFKSNRIGVTPSQLIRRDWKSPIQSQRRLFSNQMQRYPPQRLLETPDDVHESKAYLPALRRAEIASTNKTAWSEPR